MPESAWKRELRSAVPPRSIAELAESNIGSGRLQGTRWRRVARGFYVPYDAGTVLRAVGSQQIPRLTTAQRILDATPLQAEDAALGTWAAAYILGADWLDGLDPHTMADLPVEIIAPKLKRRSTATVTYRYSGLGPSDTWTRDGILITSPRRTTFDGARWATSLDEAVVFVDTMLAFNKIRLADLSGYATAHAGWTGVNQVLGACELSRPGVKSGWETRLRMCWTRDAGLPEPLVNVPIFSRTGDFLGEADLFDPDSGLIGEYDGSQHREVAQHHSDNIREEKFESVNLAVVRADKVDIRDERELLRQRLRAGHRRGQLRDRNHDDWTLTQPEWWLTRFRQH